MVQSSESTKSPLENEEIPKPTLERTPSATLQPTLLAPASISTHPQNAQITVEYPEELEKAWTALRDFWLDIIKEVEIEEELKKKYKRSHDNHKKS